MRLFGYSSPVDALRSRAGLGVCAAVVVAIAVVIGLLAFRGPRKPPNIFDTPVDDVFGYLATEDFSKLPLQERLDFLSGLARRFSGLSQSESAVAAAFFAGLTGPASEQLVDNVRVLGKDILVQGAEGYLALKTDAERAAYIDHWLVGWIRFGDGLGENVAGDGPENGKDGAGEPKRTDQEILDRITRQGRRDIERGIEINARMAQQISDFWERDFASVASPKEQGQIYRFLPAVRQRILTRQP